MAATSRIDQIDQMTYEQHGFHVSDSSKFQHGEPNWAHKAHSFTYIKEKVIDITGMSDQDIVNCCKELFDSFLLEKSNTPHMKPTNRKFENFIRDEGPNKLQHRYRVSTVYPIEIVITKDDAQLGIKTNEVQLALLGTYNQSYYSQNYGGNGMRIKKATS